MSTTEDDAIELVRRYRNNIWSCRQNYFLHRPSWRHPYLSEHEVSFKTAAKLFFRRSVFGTFLQSFNKEQTQNKEINKEKLDILNWSLERASTKELKHIASINSNVENLYILLEEAVKNCDVIDWDYLFEKVEAIRMDSFYINSVDDFPLNFKNLRVLILCANWLQDIPGANIPRKLLFLELYGNQIENVKNLVKKAPKTLLYLGLGRNKLSDDSKLHLISGRRFDALRCLDLSENDIYDLVAVVRRVANLKSLSSLQLEGNPCSVCHAYKNVVLRYIPNLLFLDNTQVLDEDKEITYGSDAETKDATLVFTCHKIIGLPPPPKEKSIIQTIHVEVLLPLLEETIIEPEPTENGKNGKTQNSKGNTLKKEVEKNGKGEKNAKEEKNGKEENKKETGKKEGGSPYKAKDEYADEVKRRVRDTSFKTARIPWAKVMEFPEEAILVQHPKNDLKAIRDTFRSNVNVKIIYLEVEAPGSKGKSDSKVKNKKQEKGKDRNGIKMDSKKTVNDEPEQKQEPKEIILKKITLANFYCELRDINWSDKTIDFYWANHRKANPQAIAVEGSLRSLFYGVTTEIPSSSPVSEGSKKKEPLPNIFTCHVGFGLKRL